MEIYNDGISRLDPARKRPVEELDERLLKFFRFELESVGCTLAGTYIVCTQDGPIEWRYQFESPVANDPRGRLARGEVTTEIRPGDWSPEHMTLHEVS